MYFTNPNQNIDDTQQIIKKTTPVEATLPLPPGFETGPIKEALSDLDDLKLVFPNGQSSVLCYF
jgi:hypothetical protein